MISVGQSRGTSGRVPRTTEFVTAIDESPSYGSFHAHSSQMMIAKLPSGEGNGWQGGSAVRSGKVLVLAHLPVYVAALAIYLALEDLGRDPQRAAHRGHRLPLVLHLGQAEVAHLHMRSYAETSRSRGRSATAR